MRWLPASATLALAVTCVVLATACDPDPVPDARNEAWVSVAIQADAGGLAVVALGGDLDDSTVEALLATIDGDVFAGRPASGRVTDNGGGVPVLEYRSTGVFSPGDRPLAAIDTRRMCDDLVAAGYTVLDVQLSVPNVDASWAVVPDQDGTVWSVNACSASPHGEIALRPDPAAFWRSLLLVAIVVAANVALAVTGSRRTAVPRWLPWTLTATAVVAAAAMISAGGAAAGDNMEVAGRLGHGANVVYVAGSAMVVLFGPLAAIAQPFYWRLPKERRPRLRRRPPPTASPAR